MGLTVLDKSVYQNALRQLLPRGSFWESQLSNKQSDISHLLDARAEELFLVRQRMADLQRESLASSALQTISDWERVLFGTNYESLDTEQRRTQLQVLSLGNINFRALNTVAAGFDRVVSKIYFPYSHACFAHTRFGIDRIASPVSFSVIFIQVYTLDNAKIEAFEAAMRAVLLANQLVFFFYSSIKEIHHEHVPSR